MRVKNSVIAILLIALVYLMPQKALAAKVPVTLPFDGGFEKDDGWFPPRGDYGRFDDEIMRSGSRSISLDVPDRTSPLWQSSRFRVKENYIYEFNVWVKTENVSDSVKLKIEWYDQGNKNIDGIYSDGIKGTTSGWQLLTLVAKAPEGTSTGHILLRLYGPGKAWFDDFSIYITDDISPNRPTNISSTRTSSSILLSWEEPELAIDGDRAEKGYNIYRSTTPEVTSSPEFLVAQNVLTTSWEDTTIIPTTPYYYCIVALDKVGNQSEISDIIFVLPNGYLTGTVKDALGNNLANAKVEAIGDNDLTYTDGTGSFRLVLPEGEHLIRVSIQGFRWVEELITIEAETEISRNFLLTSDFIFPPAPSNLQLNNQEPGLLLLQWQEPSLPDGKKVAGYNIYRSEAENVLLNKTNLLVEMLNDTQIVDVEVIPEVTYWYAVTLIDTALKESEPVFITGQALVPPRPFLLSPTSDTFIIDEPVEFRWIELQKVNYYQLEISSDPTFSKSVLVIDNIKENYYVYKRIIHNKENVFEIGLPDGEWYWRVRAFLSNGVQSLSPVCNKIYSMNTKVQLETLEPGDIDVKQISKTLEIPYLGVIPKVVTTNQEALIKFLVNSVSFVDCEVRVVDTRGKIINILHKAPVTAGLHNIIWNGRDNNGLRVRNGLYIIQVILYKEGETVNSSTKVIYSN